MPADARPTGLASLVSRLDAPAGRGRPAHPSRGAAAARGRDRAVAGVGARRGPRGVRRPRRRAAVAAPGRGRRPRPGRSARGGLDRHRVGQVDGLPAAGAGRGPPAPRAGRRARLDGALPRARPRRWRRTSGPACGRSGSTRGSRPTTATAAASCATGPATTASTSSPTPTCSTARCCPATSGGRGSCRCSTSSWSTRPTTTAASSAPTSRQVLRRLRRICARYGAQPDVRAGLGHHGRPGRHGEPAHRAAGRGGDRRRLAPGPGLAGLLGARLHLPHGENGAPVRRSAGAETADLLTDLVVDGVRTLAFVRSRRGSEQVALTAAGAARRGRPVAAGPGRGLPRRLPARGAARPRAAAAQRTAARAGGDQRARARHRRQRPRRGGDGRLPGHPVGALAAARPGRTRRRGRARRAGRPRRPARHLPRAPPGGAGRPARRGHRLRHRQPRTCSGRTCAPPPRSCRSSRTTCRSSGRPAASVVDDLVAAGLLRRRSRGLVLDRRPPGRRPRRHPLDRRLAGAAARGRHRPRGRHRRRLPVALDRPRRRGLPARRGDLGGPGPRPRRAGRRDGAQRPRLHHLGAGGHLHHDRRRASAPAGGASAGWPPARSTSPTRWCRSSSAGPPAR